MKDLAISSSRGAEFRLTELGPAETAQLPNFLAACNRGGISYGRNGWLTFPVLGFRSPL